MLRSNNNTENKQESPAIADKLAWRCWNGNHGSLEVIESDTIRLLAYGFLFLIWFLITVYSNFVFKMNRFRDMATYWSKIALKIYPSHLARSLGVNPCEFFDKSYLAREWNHGAIRWCTFHDPAFALLDNTGCDGRTDGQTGRRIHRYRKDRAMHSVARVKAVCS